MKKLIRLSDGENSWLLAITIGLARIVKVDPMFIQRARDIVKKDGSTLYALRFLSCYIRLKLRREIPGFSFNLAQQLVGEEEKRKTLALLNDVRDQIGSTKGEEAIDIQILRLKQKQTDDPEILEFVAQKMQTSIDCHLAQDRKSVDSKALHKVGLKRLFEISDLFNRHGRRFFLLSGTLLGIIRNGGLIENDIDIDIGIFGDEISPNELRELMADTGFYLKEDFKNKLGYQDRGGVSIEFFFISREDDFFVVRGFGDIIEWRFIAYDLETLNHLGHSFLIPANSIHYLEQNFGNWESEVLFYHYIFDTPCHHVSKNMQAACYFSLLLAEGLKTSDRFIVENTVRVLKQVFDIDYQYLLPRSEKRKGEV